MKKILLSIIFFATHIILSTGIAQEETATEKLEEVKLKITKDDGTIVASLIRAHDNKRLYTMLASEYGEHISVHRNKADLLEQEKRYAEQIIQALQIEAKKLKKPLK